MNHILKIILITFMCSFNLYAQEKQMLRILTWEGFFSPSLLEEFERNNNVAIEIIPYYSEHMRDVVFKNDVRKNIDLVLATQTGIIDYINSGFLVPLEFDQLSNYKYMNTNYTLNRLVKIHSITLSYGILGIAYRTDKDFDLPKTWSDFIEPNENLKGKIGLIDDADDSLDIFLMGAGNNLRSYSIEDLYHSAQLLNYFTDYIYEFGYNTREEEDALMTGRVWMAPVYGFEYYDMIKENDNLGFIFPSDSTKIWRDNLSVSANSRNKDLAFKFLNYIMKPENAAKQFVHNNYATLNTDAIDYIPQDLKNISYIYPDLSELNIVTDEIDDVFIRNKKHYFYHRIVKNKKDGDRNEITE